MAKLSKSDVRTYEKMQDLVAEFVDFSLRINEHTKGASHLHPVRIGKYEVKGELIFAEDKVATSFFLAFVIAKGVMK